jgi:hypothetical protein
MYKIRKLVLIACLGLGHGLPMSEVPTGAVIEKTNVDIMQDNTGDKDQKIQEKTTRPASTTNDLVMRGADTNGAVLRAEMQANELKYQLEKKDLEMKFKLEKQDLEMKLKQKQAEMMDKELRDKIAVLTASGQSGSAHQEASTAKDLVMAKDRMTIKNDVTPGVHSNVAVLRGEPENERSEGHQVVAAMFPSLTPKLGKAAAFPSLAPVPKMGKLALFPEKASAKYARELGDGSLTAEGEYGDNSATAAAEAKGSWGGLNFHAKAAGDGERASVAFTLAPPNLTRPPDTSALSSQS